MIKQFMKTVANEIVVHFCIWVGIWWHQRLAPTWQWYGSPPSTSKRRHRERGSAREALWWHRRPFVLSMPETKTASVANRQNTRFLWIEFLSPCNDHNLPDIFVVHQNQEWRPCIYLSRSCSLTSGTGERGGVLNVQHGKSFDTRKQSTIFGITFHSDVFSSQVHVANLELLFQMS